MYYFIWQTNKRNIVLQSKNVLKALQLLDLISLVVFTRLNVPTVVLKLSAPALMDFRYKIKSIDHERKRSSGFRRIFTLDFLLFLYLACGYNPAR